MAGRLEMGNHIIWRSEVGHINARLSATCTSDPSCKGPLHHAAEADLQEGEKTNHIVARKDSSPRLADDGRQ